MHIQFQMIYFEMEKLLKKTVKSKSGRHGLVELVDNDTAWGLRYSLVVDGKVKASSTTFNR
jgi:hypothetical protein